MGRNSIIAFVILCFAFTFLDAAQAEDDSQIRELFKKSGIEAAISHLPVALRAEGAEIRKKGLTSERFDRAFGEAAQKAYAMQSIMERMVEGFRGLLTAAEVQAALRHYNSPLGERITGMEAASAGASPKDKIAYARQAMADPERFYDRLALCRRLDEATRTTELGVTVAMHTLIALQSAMLKAGIIHGDASIDELKSRMESSRSTLRRQASQGNLISFLYAYRDLSTDEFHRYLRFLQSPPGKKLVFAFSAVFDAVLTERAVVFGDELVKNLRSLPL